MCGIFCSLSCHAHIQPDPQIVLSLGNRGPDSTGSHQTSVSSTSPSSPQRHLTFLSTVLALRGPAVVPQPLVDADTRSALCWNGEGWNIAGERVPGNDAELVFAKLIEACTHPSTASAAAVVAVLSSIRGPYALVFYDACHERLYFGRDCLGRRSLLRTVTRSGALILSSVCGSASDDQWVEVEADGLYYVDLHRMHDNQSLVHVQHIPHCRSHDTGKAQLSFNLNFPTMNKHFPPLQPDWSTQTVHLLQCSLQDALALRVRHVREAMLSATTGPQCNAQIAILFSGGLDCTIIARMCHNLLPLTDPIDLLNVAFENPRIHKQLEPGVSPYETCPDRITGRSSHRELVNVCPGRVWRFVEINVPYAETQSHRSIVMSLMHPHNTEMDLSISFALYFASKGVGLIATPSSQTLQPYSSTARVLLSGLGADELFGGYQRHARAFAYRSYSGLIEELELDFDRLGKRNLGRDDRVISNSGKEVRFPYLDEDFIAHVLRLPVTAKCDFGGPKSEGSEDPVHFLEPAKRVLRLLAWQLGMRMVATEKKRAIQFGARTAKMETGKTKGTHVLA